jgi:hypothetical protein
MFSRLCPYCHKLFAPSRYHRDQAVCSIPECQRRRQAEYRRRNIQTDPE